MDEMTFKYTPLDYRVTLGNDDLERIRQSDNFTSLCCEPGLDVLNYKDTGQVLTIKKVYKGKYKINVPRREAERIKKELGSLVENKSFL